MSFSIRPLLEQRIWSTVEDFRSSHSTKILVVLTVAPFLLAVGETFLAKSEANEKKSSRSWQLLKIGGCFVLGSLALNPVSYSRTGGAIVAAATIFSYFKPEKK